MTVVGIGCGWIGWQARIVRERKAMLNALTVEFVSGDFPGIFDIGAPKSDVSNFRKWLGDRAYSAILLPKGLPSAKLEAIQATFPEARLITLDDLK